VGEKRVDRRKRVDEKGWTKKGGQKKKKGGQTEKEKGWTDGMFTSTSSLKRLRGLVQTD
jgi:hypothetical protein